jgi:hypothetical protein
MNEENSVMIRMKELLVKWEAANDHRLIFLSCYRMMTQNILDAIEAQDFEDSAWVSRLMEHFAEYYFRALDAFESKQTNPPTAWQIAFTAAQNPHTNVLQDLVLGVNAHINYDLVLALSDVLAPEWQQLSVDQRTMRYRDHCHVNDIINHTINAVQDQVIDRFEPMFGLMDKFLGPIDEWMTSLLISDWREEVWEHVTQIIDPKNQTGEQAIITHVEQVSINRAQEILGKVKLSDLIDFI